MRILFLGDVVGSTGCSKILNNLLSQKELNKIDFVIVNGENAAEAGVGLTKEICEDFFKCGVDVITTGNHVWDQKDIMKFIDKENRLLRPKNLFEPAPGKGFEVFQNDKNCNRVGYGGGFYDRYIKRTKKIKNILTIGLAFSYQKVKKIPIEKNDVKLDFIITEKD